MMLIHCETNYCLYILYIDSLSQHLFKKNFCFRHAFLLDAKMNPNFTDPIKMEDETDEWQGHFGNGDVNFDVNFDAGQIFSETLDGADGGSGADATDEPDIIYVYMDIQSPIQTLKILLQDKTKKDLSDYDVWLQNVQMLEPFKTLVDQCVKGEGLVQVNAQILDDSKRINIADVVKPTEEVDNAMKNVEQNIGLDPDIIMDEKDHSSDSADCKWSFQFYHLNERGKYSIFTE